MQSDDEKIRQRAYEIWVREGQQEGRDQDYWLQAEGELAQETAAAPGGEDTSSASRVKKPTAANGIANQAAAKPPGRKRRGQQPLSA